MQRTQQYQPNLSRLEKIRIGVNYEPIAVQLISEIKALQIRDKGAARMLTTALLAPQMCNFFATLSSSVPPIRKGSSGLLRFTVQAMADLWNMDKRAFVETREFIELVAKSEDYRAAASIVNRLSQIAYAVVGISETRSMSETGDIYLTALSALQAKYAVEGMTGVTALLERFDHIAERAWRTMKVSDATPGIRTANPILGGTLPALYIDFLEKRNLLERPALHTREGRRDAVLLTGIEGVCFPPDMHLRL